MSVLSNEHCSRISSFTERIIRDNGYPLEVHHVTTEDGYINSIYRMMHGLKKSEQKEVRHPVLLVHGLVSSVAESIQEERNLGYYLADNGFDVWIANCRGTTYSRGHEKYDHIKDPEKYWDFSFHEIGYYDHAAFIDYILQKTGFHKVFYIGISQGTSTFSTLTSSRPEYNDKIQLACLLCPAVFFKNASPLPLRFLFCYLVPWIKRYSEIFRKPFYEAPFTFFLRDYGEKHAKPGTLTKYLITKLWDYLAGHPNPNHHLDMDNEKLSVTTPNSAAFKQFLHFSQVITHNEFKKFDYGREKNLDIYGSEKPPFYDLGKITAPVGIFYSKNDMFYGTKDIDNLAKTLKNCVAKYLVQDDGFNHLDFIYNNDVVHLLYEHVVDLMKKYTT